MCQLDFFPVGAHPAVEFVEEFGLQYPFVFQAAAAWSRCLRTLRLLPLHLEAPLVEAYFRKAKSLLREGGKLVTLVPAGMFAWGVEDDVAGHVKRYERDCFKALVTQHGLRIDDLAGLTWPLSNMLLPVSNFLVKRSESRLHDKSMLERTVASGHREVKFKTTFPWWTRLLLNRVTMLPWHGLQLLGKDSTRALILYCEMANVEA